MERPVSIYLNVYNTKITVQSKVKIISANRFDIAVFCFFATRFINWASQISQKKNSDYFLQ
jgi:hypothetical protein